MATYTQNELKYLSKLGVQVDLNKAKYEELEFIEDLLLTRMNTILVPPEYKSTEEAIVCQNILDKLFDD